MRGRLATATGYRSPPLPEGERLKPFPLWGKLKEGTRPYVVAVIRWVGPGGLTSSPNGRRLR